MFTEISNTKIDLKTSRAMLQKVMEYSLKNMRNWTQVVVIKDCKKLNLSKSTLGDALRGLAEIGLLERDRKSQLEIYYRVNPNCNLSDYESQDEDSEPTEEILDTRFSLVDSQSEPAEEILATDLAPYIESHIIEIRGEKRMLDADLAKVYGVPTRALNQAYERNKDLFEDGWVVRLTEQEMERLSQSVTTFSKFSPYLPLAFNREASNGMAFQLPQSPIARKRSKVILKVFSDIERMASGETPKDPKMLDFAKSLATGILTPVASQLQSIVGALSEIALTSQSNVAKIDNQNRKIELHDQNFADMRIQQAKAEEALRQYDLPNPRLLPETTTRQKIRMLVDNFVSAKNTRHDFVWNQLYSRFNYVQRTNLTTCANNRKMSRLDYIASIGELDHLYSIAHDLLTPPKRS